MVSKLKRAVYERIVAYAVGLVAAGAVLGWTLRGWIG